MPPRRNRAKMTELERHGHTNNPAFSSTKPRSRCVRLASRPVRHGRDPQYLFALRQSVIGAAKTPRRSVPAEAGRIRLRPSSAISTSASSRSRKERPRRLRAATVAAHREDRLRRRLPIAPSPSGDPRMVTSTDGPRARHHFVSSKDGAGVRNLTRGLTRKRLITCAARRAVQQHAVMAWSQESDRGGAGARTRQDREGRALVVTEILTGRSKQESP